MKSEEKAEPIASKKAEKAAKAAIKKAERAVKAAIKKAEKADKAAKAESKKAETGVKSASKKATKVVEINEVIVEAQITEKKKPKKRGRKPKGGKIISTKPNVAISNFKFEQNVILHLKCTAADLDDNNIYKTNSYNPTLLPINPIDCNFFTNKSETMCVDELEIKNPKREEKGITHCEDNNLSDIRVKLELLQQNLHHNVPPSTKSSCFWCTCVFDNPNIYIPKYKEHDTYHVYGCFCTPECATGFLMHEQIDESTKFERYHLMNFIYGKIFDYTKYFKPAPDPHYTLDKFCGNLTIEEYRKAFYTDEIIIVTEKPLTRIMPEIHEDTHVFYSTNNITIKKNNTYKMRSVTEEAAKKKHKANETASILK
jgi:hypothetical protein